MGAQEGDGPCRQPRADLGRRLLGALDDEAMVARYPLQRGVLARGDLVRELFVRGDERVGLPERKSCGAAIAGRCSTRGFSGRPGG